MNKNKDNLAHGFSRGSKEKNENKNLHEEVEALKSQMASMHGWTRIKRNLITLAIVIGIPMALYAITKTYSFTAGTVAKASEINKNFDDIYARLNAMEGSNIIQGNLANLKVIYGVVNTATGSIVSGSGFIFNRTSVGGGTITFTTPFASKPTVVGSAPSDHYLGVAGATTSSVSVKEYNWAGNSFDVEIQFFAIGPK